MIRSFVRKNKDEERKRITKAVTDANLNRLVDKTKKDKPSKKGAAGTPADSPQSIHDNEEMEGNDNGEDANEPEIVMEEIKEEEMGPNDFQRGRRARNNGFKPKTDKAARALFTTSKQ